MVVNQPADHYRVSCVWHIGVNLPAASITFEIVIHSAICAMAARLIDFDQHLFNAHVGCHDMVSICCVDSHRFDHLFCLRNLVQFGTSSNSSSQNRAGC